MLEERLADWNPWWAAGQLPLAWHGTPREATADAIDLMAMRHVKDIVGVRRSGKTTVLHQIVAHWIAEGKPADQIALVNFDDFLLAEAGFDQLMEGLERRPRRIRYLILDEVQARVGWERWVRTMYDLRRFEQIVVTGSSSSLLQSDLARLLTGRHVSIQVRPFSFGEFLRHERLDPAAYLDDPAQRNQILHLQDRYLSEGGFPEAIGVSRAQRTRTLTDLFSDLVARDVVARHGLTAEAARKIANWFVTNPAREFSLRRVAAATGTAFETAQKYWDHLKEAYLFEELPIHTHKLTTRYRTNKKAYCVDTGLAHCLSSSRSPDTGRLMENAVYLELRRRGYDVSYWKGEHGHEVDFVVISKGRTQLVQVAKNIGAATTREREETALAAAGKTLGIDELLIVTETGEEQAGDIPVVPLWRFLLTGPAAPA